MSSISGPSASTVGVSYRPEVIWTFRHDPEVATGGGDGPFPCERGRPNSSKRPSPDFFGASSDMIISILELGK